LISHASIHPVEEVPTTDGDGGVVVADQNVNVPMARMKDIQGMPGTVGGLSLRVLQFVFAAAALSVMAFTSYFPNIKHLPSMALGEREGFWWEKVPFWS